jgi:Putative zinc-finger
MTEKQQNSMQCSHFEALMSDALDGALQQEARQAFESHAETCPACGPMLAEARQGMLWLRSLEELEPPKNLVHNILAATTVAEAAKEPERAKALKPGWTTRLWKPARGVMTGMIQPRFVTSFAMAFFSLSLTLTLGGVRLKDLGRIDWHPSALGRAVVLEYTQVETKVVQYYKNMRLVYEIESRVSELKKAAGSGQNDQQQQQQPAEQPKENKNKRDNNDTSGRPEQLQEHYSQELNDGLIAYLRQSNEGA